MAWIRTSVPLAPGVRYENVTRPRDWWHLFVGLVAIGACIHVGKWLVTYWTISAPIAIGVAVCAWLVVRYER
jgi:hypothetical protein